jgi:hypothetical protein
VFKSGNRGASWRVISPDLGEAAGGERAVVPYGALTSLAESRFAPGILYAGTEGGNVYVTRNDGAEWKKVSGGLPGKWVTRTVASEHDIGTVYLSMSGYRQDDFAPYLFRSVDFGANWVSIAGNLPDEPVNVVREDPKRSNILYVGTDAGVYVSFDRGTSWVSLCADLPTTPVQDLVIHPREDELIIATHGRSMFLLDVRPLQAITDEIRSSPLHLFDLRPVRMRWQVEREVAPHPPRGRASIHYWLDAPGQVAITIRDAVGETVRTLTVHGLRGVNRAEWDVRRDNGRDAGPGVHLVEVTAGDRHAAATLIIGPPS